MSVHSIVSGSLLEKGDGKQREDFAREVYVLFMYVFFFLKLDVRTTCRIRHAMISSLYQDSTPTLHVLQFWMDQLRFSASVSSFLSI